MAKINLEYIEAYKRFYAKPHIDKAEALGSRI